ncbi:Gfo/Idh/MocA family protein [Paenibacillus sacheonensis]|uniref:Gfo/Idh/MocA family oxidoreductase n=1 Tax=Paenibacillus sacheonensis TaxID=742054 RepID=A0A7X4YM98_9BACL|nr:Gfo/Idh/MocA family oxidoreductase [Paenibacillus sacheonensis]MBM7563228.1 putative dehydrogenase [Paenibacillus sacheonensis]NBC68211.1 Gfo/Idh/MocA family oxidoreductase [Paenibacillus sacheonensis]
MIRVAVVGVNNIGKIHCLAYKRNPDTELVAVCDLMPERAEAAGRLHGVPAYADLRELLASENVDAVIVATAGVEKGSHHYEPVMIALEAGKAVFVEKPISNNIEEARRMVAFAREKNLVLACNLNHRFTPAAYRAKELVDGGKLGDLLFLNMRLTIQNPQEDTEWLHMRALHPHSIDVMRYFAGDIKRVQAFMTKGPGRTSWSTVSVNMEFASGAVGHLTGSYDMSMRHPIEYCEVAGHQGRLVVDNVYENMTYYPHHSDELTVVRNSIFGGMNGFDDTFGQRIGKFIEELKNGVKPEEITASGADALAAQEVIEAAIQSHRSGGAPVTVPS